MFIKNELFVMACILIILICLLLFSDNIKFYIGSNVVSPESIYKSLKQN